MCQLLNPTQMKSSNSRPGMDSSAHSVLIMTSPATKRSTRLDLQQFRHDGPNKLCYPLFRVICQDVTRNLSVLGTSYQSLRLYRCDAPNVASNLVSWPTASLSLAPNREWRLAKLSPYPSVTVNLVFEAHLDAVTLPNLL